MITRHQIIIPCQPANPVDYLACCGLADLLAHMDRTARTHWRTVAPLAFVMESTLTEAEFLATLLATFRTASRWRFIPVHDSEEPARIEVEFTPEGRDAFTVPLDWWYETLDADGKITNSAWKMYAANQTVKGTTLTLLEAAASMAEPNSIATLLTAGTPMTGRFGFDPRSSRDALNAGYSANDLKLPVKTYPFAELLVTFGAAAFFPSRCGRAGDLSSSRGWRGRSEGRAGFAYYLWPLPLPTMLARLAAGIESVPGALLLFAGRNYRGQFSNLEFAHLTAKHTKQ